MPKAQDTVPKAQHTMPKAQNTMPKAHRRPRPRAPRIAGSQSGGYGSAMSRLEMNLATLIGPTPTAEFLSSHWQAAPALLVRQLDVAGLTAAIPELFDLRRLARRYHDPVPILLDPPIELPAADAVERYEKAGATLRFIDLHRFLPATRRWRDRIGRELGLPPERSKCSLYASPRGYGLPWHYDSNDNFVIQLAGRKRWSLAENPSVRQPVHDSMWLGQPEPDGLRGYAPDGLPARIGRGVRSFELEPGTVLYLPRGHWHSTECTRATSLSMNFTFSAYSYCELLLPCIERALLGHEKWRTPARGASGSEAQREAARNGMARLLAGLSEDLAVLAAEDIVRPGSPRAPRALGPDEPLLRSALVMPAVQGPMPGSADTSFVTFKGPPNRDQDALPIASRHLPVLGFVLRHREVTLAMVSAAHPEVDAGELGELLRALLTVGFLRRPGKALSRR